ncbi:CHAT domain-containing protein [Streptomyces sp. NPDC051815]|uniref:CHAT domain-containing protein n=1 Tax=Streptomyces sp. NPDC051815 TaxID=3365674 RepID=UPI0037882009
MNIDDVSTDWAGRISVAIDSSDAEQLAEVCLAADLVVAHSSIGRPLVRETRTAARALQAAAHQGAVRNSRSSRYQRVVALVFSTWRPRMLPGTEDPRADIHLQAQQCAQAVEAARRLADPLMVAWALYHQGVSLWQAQEWEAARAALTEAVVLTGDRGADGPGPFAACPGAHSGPPVNLRAAIACRALKYTSILGESLGDVGLSRSAMERMVSLAETLVAVQPDLLAEGLARQGQVARHVGDRDGFRAVETRLRTWAEQSGLNRARRTWLAQAAYNASHLQDHTRSYRLHLQRLAVAVEDWSLPEGAPEPSAVLALVPRLLQRGLRGRRITVGNSAYDLAVQLWRTGLVGRASERWAEASDWLDVAEACFADDGHNGLAAVHLTRARLQAVHPTHPDLGAATDRALEASAAGLRVSLQVNAAVAAAEWSAPGDSRVADCVNGLLARATPRHRGVLLYAVALHSERKALDSSRVPDMVRWYGEAEAAALEAAAALEVGGILLDMKKAARVWAIAARACRHDVSLSEDRMSHTALARLTRAVRCVAELFITVSDLEERRSLCRDFGHIFQDAADLAVRLGDTSALDTVMEAARRDRVGSLISDLSRSPGISDAVRRAAEQVIASNAAQPAASGAAMAQSAEQETRALARSADAIARMRERSVRHADHILGVLGALADGRGVPRLEARTVLELCLHEGVGAVLQLLSSHIGVLDSATGPRRLYRRLTWRDEDGLMREHLDSVALPFDPQAMTPEWGPYWQTVPRLTTTLLPEPLLNLLAGRGSTDPLRLLIVPTGLFDIAYDTLVLDNERQLIDAAVVSIHSSLTTMAHLMARATLPTVQPSIAVYDLRLTHAEPEFRSLEAHLAPLFEITERAALLDALNTAHPAQYRMLALAVHGTDDQSDGWGQTKILPDGCRLTAAEAMALSFPQLCVLASCHSSVRLRGGLELAGFPLALFARGATTVIGSLHEIDDEATSEIMQRFWRELGRDGNPVRALRAAKTGWIEEVPSRRLTPRLWGGLIVLGGAQF